MTEAVRTIELTIVHQTQRVRRTTRPTQSCLSSIILRIISGYQVKVLLTFCCNGGTAKRVLPKSTIMVDAGCAVRGLGED